MRRRISPDLRRRQSEFGGEEGEVTEGGGRWPETGGDGRAWPDPAGSGAAAAEGSSELLGFLRVRGSVAAAGLHIYIDQGQVALRSEPSGCHLVPALAPARAFQPLISADRRPLVKE